MRQAPRDLFLTYFAGFEYGTPNEMLLHRALVNKTDSDTILGDEGSTALMFAAEYADGVAVPLLLRHGGGTRPDGYGATTIGIRCRFEGHRPGRQPGNELCRKGRTRKHRCLVARPDHLNCPGAFTKREEWEYPTNSVKATIFVLSVDPNIAR